MKVRCMARFLGMVVGASVLVAAAGCEDDATTSLVEEYADVHEGGMLDENGNPIN